MADASIDRNMLFGVLALQDDLITDAQFADVCAGWALQTQTPLADLLIERKWIAPADRDAIERRLDRKLAKHGGNARATLGDVAGAEVRDVIRQVESPVVRQTLALLPPAPSFIRVETLVRPPPEARSRYMLSGSHAESGADQDDLTASPRSRYTLSRPHAEGGLGKVWVAVDSDLNREVALKEIRSDQTINPDASRRFVKEAQVTGQLEHPNIVPVYELGYRPEDGQPFYTMRFIRGRTLFDAIVDHHQRRGTGPADPLERQKLLNAFVAVAQAIGYAHSRGVVHRDLKPANVVMGAFGEVILLDWGLAKLVDQPDETEPEAAKVLLSMDAVVPMTVGQLGTPNYMAPEQAEGKNDLVDGRTDVYGLGAILFEVLTGHPPIEAKTQMEVMRQVVSRPTPHARSIVPSVPKALDAICAKAMAKARADRYPRALELAEDVQRWIADEPVSAYRDSLPARLIRWARRHKPLVASLAALLATAVLLLIVGVVLIDRERAHTETQRRIAVANAKQALQNFRLAQDAADGLLGEVADVELADLPQMETVRKRLLEKAQAGYQEFLNQKGNDPLVRWGASRAQVRLGDVQALLGNLPAAEASYKEAIAVLDSLVKLDPANADFPRDLARGLQGLGVLLKDANRYESAELLIRRAIALRTDLAQGPKPKPDDLQALADSRYQLGALLARRGAGGTGDQEAYREALKVQEALVRKYADQPSYLARLARYRNNYAKLLSASGQAKEAEAAFRETLDLLAPALKSPDALPGPRWQLARADNNLGTLLLARKDDDEAGTRFDAAREVLQKLMAEFPDVPQYQEELASVVYNLGLRSQRAGRLDEAVVAYAESARLFGALRTKFSGTPTYRQKLAQVQFASAEAQTTTAPAEAATALKKALEEEAALVAEYPEVPEYKALLARGHYRFARLALARNQPAEAVREAEQATAFYQSVLQARPDSDAVRAQLVENQVLYVLGLIGADRLPDAKAAAEQLPKARPDDATSYIHAASLLVKCAAAAPSTVAGRRFVDSCGTAAVKVLRDAVRRKLIRSQDPLNYKEFVPLRNRDDFKKLHAALAPPATG